MSFPEGNLLDGERAILKKNANMLVLSSAMGMAPMPSSGLVSGLLGGTADEALGGRLTLTTHRLVFTAHAVNRITGSFSLFLPTINQLDDLGSLLVKRMRVSTDTYAITFVVWGVPALMAAIGEARERLAATPGDLIDAVLAHPASLGPDADFAPIAARLLTGDFDQATEVLPWPQNTLGMVSAVNTLTMWTAP